MPDSTGALTPQEAGLASLNAYYTLQGWSAFQAAKKAGNSTKGLARPGMETTGTMKKEIITGGAYSMDTAGLKGEQGRAFEATTGGQHPLGLWLHHAVHGQWREPRHPLDARPPHRDGAARPDHRPVRHAVVAVLRRRPGPPRLQAYLRLDEGHPEGLRRHVRRRRPHPCVRAQPGGGVGQPQRLLAEEESIPTSPCASTPSARRASGCTWASPGCWPTLWARPGNWSRPRSVPAADATGAVLRALLQRFGEVIGGAARECLDGLAFMGGGWGMAHGMGMEAMFAM